MHAWGVVGILSNACYGATNVLRYWEVQASSVYLGLECRYCVADVLVVSGTKLLCHRLRSGLSCHQLVYLWFGATAPPKERFSVVTRRRRMHTSATAILVCHAKHTHTRQLSDTRVYIAMQLQYKEPIQNKKRGEGISTNMVSTQTL